MIHLLIIIKILTHKSKYSFNIVLKTIICKFKHKLTSRLTLFFLSDSLVSMKVVITFQYVIYTNMKSSDSHQYQHINHTPIHTEVSHDPSSAHLLGVNSFRKMFSFLQITEIDDVWARTCLIRACLERGCKGAEKWSFGGRERLHLGNVVSWLNILEKVLCFGKSC